jgi:hypothetical protein
MMPADAATVPRPLKTIPFTSAHEFLEALAPASSFFRGDYYTQLRLFRGCASASWKLLPIALRNAAGKSLGEQVQKEAEALVDFLSRCDELGLTVPHDSPDLRNHAVGIARLLWRPRLLDKITQAQWPTDRWLGLMTLAQHSGLPTRLLDWSRSPFVGAYFAALPDQRVSEDDEMAVWLLNAFTVTTEEGVVVDYPALRSTFMHAWVEGWKGFAVADVSRSGNSRIVAQHGYLTAHLLASVPDLAWD